jgi:hypothetical protein
MDGPEVFARLRQAFGTSVIVGCSSAGEIHGTRVADGTVSVAVARFERTNLSYATTGIENASDSWAAGANLARQLLADDLRGVLLFSDGLNVNGSELVRGLNSILPRSVVVTGGLAGDADRFKRTWVLDRGVPRTNTIVAIGFHGDNVSIGHGSRGGWDMFGPERIVTRSNGNKLYELDGKPALELYKRYLGDRADGLPATALLFPLALRDERGDEKQLVRTVLGVDEGEQSMTFAGDIPQGSLAQLMRANFDRLIEGASGASLAACPAGGAAAAVLAVAISCVGRRLVLGQRTEEEVEATLEALPPNAHQVGFYSYGELSPYASGTCDLHNQTMTLTTFCER